jgi:hypothetical protein
MLRGWQARLPCSGPVISRIPKRLSPACSSTPMLLPQECCECRYFRSACAPADLQKKNSELALSSLLSSVMPLHTSSPSSGCGMAQQRVLGSYPCPAERSDLRGTAACASTQLGASACPRTCSARLCHVQTHRGAFTPAEHELKSSPTDFHCQKMISQTENSLHCFLESRTARAVFSQPTAPAAAVTGVLVNSPCCYLSPVHSPSCCCRCSGEPPLLLSQTVEQPLLLLSMFW